MPTSGNIVLKFYAEWCSPCKQLTATIASLPYYVDVRPVDIEAEGDVALRYGVRGIPTMIVVDKGTLDVATNVTTTHLVGSGTLGKDKVEDFLKGANPKLDTDT